MQNSEFDVVVIGGGATGVGCVRDVAMRGFSVALLDRADLGQGTTGRYHGLLHSGGRYVVSDPHSATQCAEENRIVTRIHADAVETTGGLFVVTPEDDLEFSDRFLAGAKATGVPVEEISLAEALRREPRLNPGIKRAFAVQDGSVDGWQMLWGAAHSAQEHGAEIMTYCKVTGIEVEQGQVAAVTYEDQRRGEQGRISCKFVINAAGPWAGQIAKMIGCQDVEVVPGRGIMIAMNHRLVNTVVNRCVYPTDGDILVPVHTVSIIGTTDQKAEDPDKLPIPRAEVQKMLDCGEALVPGFRQQRAVHAWAGARPLIRDTSVAANDTRHMKRGMGLIDHFDRNGVKGIITVAGGKLTTYRLMAKEAVDLMCKQLGENRPCTTDKEVVPGSAEGFNYKVTHRLKEREEEWQTDQIICECELMSRSMFEGLFELHPDATFDDLRRQLRLGMGPCQGGFCSLRAAGITTECSHKHQQINIEEASEKATRGLRLFLKNRWIGLWPILFGKQVRQTAMDDWIFHGLLDVRHLPNPEDTGPAVPAVWEDPASGFTPPPGAPLKNSTISSGGAAKKEA